MKKVLTMTLNPCIDRTVYFDEFHAGETNIVKKVMEEAAGKGINVAIGLQHVQVPVKAMGFAYKEGKDKIYAKLEAEQIPYTFVEVEGRLRVNQKLFDESKSEMTECNEKGMPVLKGDVDKLLKLLKNELVDASVLVLSGSVPPGVDKDIYAIMTSMANESGIKVVLDASGDLLREGIKAKPYLIKPNKDEFVKTFMKGYRGEGLKADAKNEVSEAEMEDTKNEEPEVEIEHIARNLILQGISHICLSMGANGAILWSKLTENESESIKTEKRPAIIVPIRSLQGAGDAMVSGLCKAIYEETEDKMLDYALNMAASTIMLEGTRMGKI